MDQSDDCRELEHKIERASRIAKTITDQTTIERLRGWVEELIMRLSVEPEFDAVRWDRV